MNRWQFDRRVQLANGYRFVFVTILSWNVACTCQSSRRQSDVSVNDRSYVPKSVGFAVCSLPWSWTCLRVQLWLLSLVNKFPDLYDTCVHRCIHKSPPLVQSALYFLISLTKYTNYVYSVVINDIISTLVSNSLMQNIFYFYFCIEIP